MTTTYTFDQLKEDVRKEAEAQQRHYYEWGNEPRGYVSTGHYENNSWIPGDQMTKEEAINNGFTFHNPHP